MSTGTHNLLQCIGALGRFPSGLTVAEIASITGLTWQSTNRLLEGLLEESYLVKEVSSKKYKLSMGFCELASLTLQANPVINIARKEIIKLSMVTGRRCDFLILDGLDAMILERCDLVDGVPINRSLLARATWYENAAGLAIVAFSSDLPRKLIIDQTLKRKDLRPPNRERLGAILTEVKERGFAFSPDIRPGGLTGIVMPLLDRTGAAVAGIGSRLPAVEVEQEAGSFLISQMRSTAEVISHYLGFEEQVPDAVG